jgi:nitrogen regulatory protein P-II 2
MATVSAKLVTIVTTSEAESTITKALRSFGVRGFTVLRARGVGEHGIQSGGFFGGENIVLHVVASPAIAAQILTWVEDSLVKSAPAIAYAGDVEAVPGTIFVESLE